MSSKYKVSDSTMPHFVTFTVVGWIDIFSREDYKEIVVNSLNYCIAHKELELHAWVIMTNHVHLIISSKVNNLADIVRDIKKYTSKQIIQNIISNQKESRKNWLTNSFAFSARTNKNNKDFQFWQQYYHPVSLESNILLTQRLNYLHENPVRSGLVWEPWHFKYSSAIDYYTNEKGLIELKMI
jgi:putative transposase